MSDNENLRRQIAARIFEKTGIAINIDDPIVIVTLSIIELMDDNLIPFTTQLEATTDLLNSIEQKTENYINVTKQYLIKSGQTEMGKLFNPEIKRTIEEIKKLNSKNMKTTFNMVIFLGAVTIFQLIIILILLIK